MKRFLKWFAVTFGFVSLILIVLLAYSYFIEPSRLVVNKVEIKVPHWSRELDGFKIVAVSDLHGGSNNVTEARLRYLTEQINAQNPDLIVLLGDFVSQNSGKHGDLKMPIETVAENIKNLRARYGVFAIIGNHDWWYDEKRVKAALEGAGIKVLENETFSFPVNNRTVTIWGIEDFWKRRQVPLDALSKIEPQENIIAITHNPDSFDQTPDAASLVLAGHTHGGQVLLPFYGAPVLVAQRKYYAGHVTENGRHLFVTTGFGTTGPPLRFRVPPEIAVIIMQAQ